MRHKTLPNPDAHLNRLQPRSRHRSRRRCISCLALVWSLQLRLRLLVERAAFILFFNCLLCALLLLFLLLLFLLCFSLLLRLLRFLRDGAPWPCLVRYALPSACKNLNTHTCTHTHIDTNTHTVWQSYQMRHKNKFDWYAGFFSIFLRYLKLLRITKL